MTELEALSQLIELVETIEKNNWEGIYKALENNLSFTPRTTRQQKEIENLKKEIEALRGLSKDTENKNSTLRIKLAAIKNLLEENGDTGKTKEVSTSA